MWHHAPISLKTISPQFRHAWKLFSGQYDFVSDAVENFFNRNKRFCAQNTDLTPKYTFGLALGCLIDVVWFGDCDLLFLANMDLNPWTSKRVSSENKTFSQCFSVYVLYFRAYSNLYFLHFKGVRVLIVYITFLRMQYQQQLSSCTWTVQNSLVQVL